MIITKNGQKQPLDLPNLDTYYQAVTVKEFKKRYRLTNRELAYCLSVRTKDGLKQPTVHSVHRWVNQQVEDPCTVQAILILLDAQWKGRLKEFGKYIRIEVSKGQHRYEPKILENYNSKLSLIIPSNWVFNEKILPAYFYGELSF